MSPKWKSSSIRKLAKKHSNSQHTSGNEFILPNVSGDHVRSIKRDAPVDDSDLVNKKYVDDNIPAAYTDADAVAAVATADDYVKIVGDTMTGDLFVNSTYGFQIGGDALTTNACIYLSAGTFWFADAAGNVENIGCDTVVANNVTIDTTTLVTDSTNNRVGIGTAAPKDKLEVMSTASGVYRSQLLLSDDNAIAAGRGGQINFGGRYVGTTHTEWAGIQGTKETATAQYGGELRFRTRAHGAALADKMIIKAGGNVGIGTATPGYKLEVNGDIQLTSDNDFILFGTGEDAKIYYNGTDLIIDPDVVGSGEVKIGVTGDDNIRANWVYSTRMEETTRGQFFTYKTTAQVLTTANTWYDVTFADVDAPVKQGFTHERGTNPEQITVTNAGTYLISAQCNIYSNSATSYRAAIRILDDGTEINGSYANEVGQYWWVVSTTVIAKLGAGSVIELQATTNLNNLQINNGASGAAPTTDSIAQISITKLSNDS